MDWAPAVGTKDKTFLWKGVGSPDRGLREAWTGQESEPTAGQMASPETPPGGRQIHWEHCLTVGLAGHVQVRRWAWMLREHPVRCSEWRGSRLTPSVGPLVQLWPYQSATHRGELSPKGTGGLHPGGAVVGSLEEGGLMDTPPSSHGVKAGALRQTAWLHPATWCRGRSCPLSCTG